MPRTNLDRYSCRLLCTWVEKFCLVIAVSAAKLIEACMRCDASAIMGHYEERRLGAGGVIIQPHDWEGGPDEQMPKQFLHMCSEMANNCLP